MTSSKDTKPTSLIIEVEKGCVNVASEIPEGVKLIVKDYDCDDGEKSDGKGKYEETVWTSADNEGLLARLKRGY